MQQICIEYLVCARTILRTQGKALNKIVKSSCPHGLYSSWGVWHKMCYYDEYKKYISNLYSILGINISASITDDLIN